MTPMEHREAREFLPSLIDGVAAEMSGLKEHVSACAECQEELASYRALARTLHSLADNPRDAPEWLLASVKEKVRGRAELLEHLPRGTRRLADPRVAVAGGALVAAGVVSALIVRRRRRGRGARLRQALARA